MDPETEKCLFDGMNDGQSAAENGHFYSEMVSRFKISGG